MDSLTAIMQGRLVPADLLGALRDSTSELGDAGRAQANLANDGYVFLREVVSESVIRDARRADARRRRGFG